MVIKKVTTISFLLLSLALLAVRAFAQTNVTPLPTASGQGQPAAKSVTWACLESPKYNPHTDTPAGVRLGTSDKRLMKASGTGFPTDVCVYVVGCINTENNIECTSGDSSLDKNADLNLTDPKTGEANATRLRRLYRYTFIVDGGSKKCNLPDGNLETVVFSESGPETIHTVWAVYPTKVDASVNENSGKSQTLKYGTFGFQGGPGTCSGQRWDPYGVVFDSQSLEPLPDSSVTLLDTANAKIVLPGLANPVSTQADGLFNFLPEPGSYKLDIAKNHYTFSAFPSVHANYTKAYGPLYKPEDIIIEKAGSEEHRDAALDPGSNLPYRADPQHMSYGVVQTGTTLRVSGKQTHPLTIVTFMQEGAEIGRDAADKFGYYTHEFANTAVRADSLITVYFTKVDLTADSQGQPVQAYETSPIPPYIEGRALDDQGTVLGGATVKIKLEMTDKPYAETTAADDGSFHFEPRDVPPIAYHLEYIPANGGRVVSKSVIDFVRENQTYLSENNIDLMTATKNGQPLISQAPSNTSPTPQVVETAQPTGNQGAVLKLLILFVVVLFFAFYLYAKRLKLPHSDTTPPSKPEETPQTPIETDK